MTMYAVEAYMVPFKMTEEKLIIGCREGNRVAQEELYLQFSSKVMGVCRRYANTREDSKDIFQEAFINIYRALQQNQQIEFLSAWIRKITANTAINYYYKNKRHAEHLSIEGFHEKNNSDYDMILSELRKEDLMQLIEILPLGCKHVFNLYVIEGYSHKEITSIMNISEGTSKSQLSRAKEIMKLRLNAFNRVKYKKVI